MPFALQPLAAETALALERFTAARKKEAAWKDE